jgi:hypothetical protein
VSYAVQFLEEALDHETKEDGEIVRTTHGVERIPDPMLLKEMQAYRKGLNVDRLVAFCSLVAFAKVQESNRGYSKRIEREENLDNKNKMSKLFSKSPFRNVGGTKPRSPFKNFR